MNEIESLIQWITELISEHLFLGVFLAALIETVFPPIPTLAIFPVAGYIASQSGAELLQVIILGIVGGIGATIGSTVIYFVAYFLGRKALLKYLRYARISEEKLVKIESWFERHGDKTVFFGRMVPVMREMISVPAGLLKMNIGKFLLFTFLGSCVYSTGVILAGYYFGISVFGN
ncbi:MAG: DedA family protein [Crenarchaeota archaeon]|nr:MAG: DedA family protein [Thermoproteota archaeon]RDJ34148.1 MAG: DedA family protein [Thermoproteota archaeon]RDJ36736.1 MAG: DedA family protein [Thermoproteota archaeon]RDJ37730.1 MAG: DedA family protein [Thermoproteota archaeon]